MHGLAMWRPALAVALCMCAPHAMAQEVPTGADPDARSAYNNKMYRVEVKGTPVSDLDRRRRSNVRLQVLGRDELDKFGDTTLADALKRMPGVEVQGGALRLRGLGSGYAQILINGEPAPNGFSVDQLSPSQVERVEVANAPTADQSAQAVAGNINIILKAAPKQREVRLRVGASYSTVRVTPNVNFSVGDTLGPVSYVLPVSAFEGRGVNQLAVARRVPAADGFDHSVQLAEQPLWGHTFNASPQLKWRLGVDETLSLQAFLQKSYWNSRVLFTNVDESAPALLEDPSLNQGTYQNQRYTTQWQKRLNDTQRVELKLTLGRAEEDFANQTYRATLPYRISGGDSRDRTTIFAGKFEQLVGDAHTVAAGWEDESRKRNDQRVVTVDGAPQLPGIDGLPFDARIARQAYYVQDEWAIAEQWLAYGGLRYERIRIDSSDARGAVGNTSSVLAPLLHLTYKIDPKGKDLVRASLTRTYKTPDLYAIIGRPALNSLFPLPDQANLEIAADRAGNPGLRPELATGLDVSYERYFGTGGVVGISVFHRKITDLNRYVTALETVPWASTPRWVTRPQNFSRANSSGLELETRGRAGDLLPSLFSAKTDLTLRAALNVYRSRVDAVSRPDNRLDGQQPWSTTLGFDYKASSLPLAVGASLAYTPGYVTQQTIEQAVDQSRTRALDLYAQWTLARNARLRLAATNAAPVSTWRSVDTTSGSTLRTARKARAGYALTLDMSF